MTTEQLKELYATGIPRSNPKGEVMGTLIYCDADDCRNSDHSYDEGIFDIPEEIAKAIGLSEYDSHLCKNCIDNSEHELGIKLVIVNDDEVIIEANQKEK